MNTPMKSASARSSQICADCSAPDASWASLNRGVLICDECCSVHRILGRHISQIKSLKKSPWAPSQLTMVTLLYAKGANLLWEHSLFHPANFSPNVKINRRKPSPKDPIHPNKSEFIRAKYQLQSFIHRPGKDEPTCSCDDLSQQLHSSVRTSNVEISLRLLCLGADPNFWHPEKGNRPLHVAARAGQSSQVELLIVYAADPGAPDIAGKTPGDHARSGGFLDMAERLMECQYELTDRLAFFLSRRKTNHPAGQHFIIPQLTTDRSPDFLQLAKTARRNVQGLSNSLFESLSMDIYDEVDRQETENIWQASQGPTTTTSSRHLTAFLPVNPKLSAVHNQARQKLARLHPAEFAALIVDVLTEVRRRQTGLDRSPTGLDRSPTVESFPSDTSTVTEDPLHQSLNQPLSSINQPLSSISSISQSVNSAVLEEEDDHEPLYDTVAVDDDYVDAKDDRVFGKNGSPGGAVGGTEKTLSVGQGTLSLGGAGGERIGGVGGQCLCQRIESGVLLGQSCPVCDCVITASQYFEMKKALKEAVERETRLTSTVYAMKEDLNRLFTQVGTLLNPVSDKLPPHNGGSSSSSKQSQVAKIESVFFAKSLRDDSGIQEGHDETPPGLEGQHSTEHSDGVSLPSLELLNGKTGVITHAIQDLKKAAEAVDSVTFASCTTRIENSVQDLVDLFQPFQFKFPVSLGKALSDLSESTVKLSTDCRHYVQSLPTTATLQTTPTSPPTTPSSLIEGARGHATQMVIDDAYNVAMSLKDVLVLHASQLTSQRSDNS